MISKQGWQNYYLLGAIKNRYYVSAGFMMDVNTSVLGENTLEVMVRLNNSLYLSIGIVPNFDYKILILV